MAMLLKKIKRVKKPRRERMMLESQRKRRNRASLTKILAELRSISSVRMVRCAKERPSNKIDTMQEGTEDPAFVPTEKFTETIRSKRAKFSWINKSLLKWYLVTQKCHMVYGVRLNICARVKNLVSCLKEHRDMVYQRRLALSNILKDGLKAKRKSNCKRVELSTKSNS